MSLTLIRRARASRLSAARCACDTARARHPARADGRGLLVVRFLWCTPRTARFVATVGQIFWRLRRAARSDLDESKACGTHEHALGGLSTKSYSRFVLRCSRKEASTNFRRLRRAVLLCTHNLASLACGSIVRPSYTRIDRANAYATARRHANTSHFFVLPRQIQNFRRLRRAGPDSPLIDKHHLCSARDRACRRRVLRRRYAPGGRF